MQLLMIIPMSRAFTLFLFIMILPNIIYGKTFSEKFRDKIPQLPLEEQAWAEAALKAFEEQNESVFKSITEESTQRGSPDLAKMIFELNSDTSMTEASKALAKVQTPEVAEYLIYQLKTVTLTPPGYGNMETLMRRQQTLMTIEKSLATILQLDITPELDPRVPLDGFLDKLRVQFPNYELKLLKREKIRPLAESQIADEPSVSSTKYEEQHTANYWPAFLIGFAWLAREMIGFVLRKTKVARNTGSKLIR
jgi:hypothetical protein